MSGNCRDYITEMYKATNYYPFVIYSSEEFSLLSLDDENFKSLTFFSKNPMNKQYN